MLSYFLQPKVSVKLRRLGSKNDGGYFVPKKIIPLTENLICFGLGFNWDFEKDFLKYNKFCKLITYDHTVTYFSLIKNFFQNLFFSIRYRKEPGKIFKLIDYFLFFYGYRAIHKKNKIGYTNIKKQKQIDLDKVLKNKKKIFLKIDIESDEYKILDKIIKYQKDILCLVIEFHKIGDNLKKLKKFYKKFKLVNCNTCPNNSSGLDNKNNTKTIEVTFINKIFFKKDDYQKKIVSKCSINNPYKKKIILNYNKS